MSAETLSAYELERRENIARNHTRLRELGLEELPPPRVSSTSVGSTTGHKRPRMPPAPTAPTAAIVVRRSSRERTPVSHFGDMASIEGLALGRERKPGASRITDEVSEDDHVDADDDDPGADAQATPAARSSELLDERPAADPGTSRSIRVDVAHVLSMHLGGSIEGPATKQTVVTALAGNRPARFSKYSGSLEWKNCVVLWVNIGGTDYNNNFLNGGARVTWFASQRSTEDSPVVQRLIHSTRHITRPEAESGAGSLATRAASSGEFTSGGQGSVGGGEGSAGGAEVLLFCRLIGEPYICCGRLSYVSHDARRLPVKFIWDLVDHERLKPSEDFRQIIAVK
jgi:hypothetical protein